MSHFLLKSSAVAVTLALIGFAGTADAAMRTTLPSASNLTILAADEENSEVENLLDPEADQGTPMDAPDGDGAMKAKPMEEAAPPPASGDAETEEMKKEE